MRAKQANRQLPDVIQNDLVHKMSYKPERPQVRQIGLYGERETIEACICVSAWVVRGGNRWRRVYVQDGRMYIMIEGVERWLCEDITTKINVMLRTKSA